MDFQKTLALSLVVFIVTCESTTTNVVPEKPADHEKPVITVNATSAASLPNLCDACVCKEHSVKCIDRRLETIFGNVTQWPKIPIDEISFEGNLLVHLTPFPAVTIRKLILRKNRISKIDRRAFKQLFNLTELDLSHNQLTSELLKPEVFEGRFSPESYEPLAKLRVLNLASNFLHSLDQDVFEHLGDLKKLDLSDNPFTIIDAHTTLAISSFPYLEELNLSYCQLEDLPKHLFHKSRYLSRLDLSGNNFTTLPTALEYARALEYLRLDENPIKIVGHLNVFPPLPKLKELSLCCTADLVEVGRGAFSELTALEVLRVQHCPHLKTIDENALVKQTSDNAIWPPLKILDLSDNALRYLPSGLVGRWDKLEELDLMNNEWSCDCDNQYLISTLIPEYGKKLMADEADRLKCHAPPEHLNKNLSSLSDRHLRCLDYYNARPEKDAAVLIGIVIGLLLAIPIGLAMFIFWQRGFFFCNSQGPASFSRAFYKRTANDDDI